MRLPDPIFALVCLLPATAMAEPAAPAPVCKAGIAPMVHSKKGCGEKVPETARREIRSAADGVALLGSVTQLLSPLGRPVLTSNFETTVAINNHATPAAKAQAIIDAQITDENANTLADGLGKTMGEAYRRKAYFCSENDGRTQGIGEIDPAVTALIEGVDKVSSGASGEGKCAFANGVELHQEGRYKLPPGGTYNVFGRLYEPKGVSADPYGNSRPFQTAPIGATSGPRTHTYDGKDFFGVRMNSAVLLRGASKAEQAAGQYALSLETNPSFPSGHTTFGYTEALILAMMVPERYRALAYRGSEYGDSRIVLGAHYALDVIGGRTLATYELAQSLAGTPGYPGPPMRPRLAKAAAAVRDYLKQNGCPDIAACAREPIERAADATILTKGEIRPASPEAAYAFRLNYGLAPMGSTTREPDPVPPEAAALLETRFPYLTQAQRLEVLRTTEGPAGAFLDVSPLDGKPLAANATGAEAQAGTYSRLNLFAAAGGFTSFADQMVVDQSPSADPDLAPFADLSRSDIWSNDISGPGGLTKRGSGRLTLAGSGSYAGPTIVEGGTLDVAGSVHSAIDVKAGGTLAGTGQVDDIAVTDGGTLAPGNAEGRGSLVIRGRLSLGKGAGLSLGDIAHALTVAGGADIEGATLALMHVDASKPGTKITLIAAKGGVKGRFASVTTDAPAMAPKLTYEADAVYLTLERTSEARTDTSTQKP